MAHGLCIALKRLFCTLEQLDVTIHSHILYTLRICGASKSEWRAEKIANYLNAEDYSCDG